MSVTDPFRASRSGDALWEVLAGGDLTGGAVTFGIEAKPERARFITTPGLARFQWSPIASDASLVLDTSQMTIYELRDAIKQRLLGTSSGSMSILVQSFGFKRGVPPDADLARGLRRQDVPLPTWLAEGVEADAAPWGALVLLGLGVLLAVAGLVGVLHPEDEHPALLAGQQPVEQRGTGPTHVEVSGG